MDGRCGPVHNAVDVERCVTSPRAAVSPSVSDVLFKAMSLGETGSVANGRPLRVATLPDHTTLLAGSAFYGVPAAGAPGRRSLSLDVQSCQQNLLSIGTPVCNSSSLGCTANTVSGGLAALHRVSPLTHCALLCSCRSCAEDASPPTAAPSRPFPAPS